MWFENGTEKARKQRNENSKRLIKSVFLGNADISSDLLLIVIYAFFRHKKDRATVAPLLGLVVIYKIA